MGGLGAGMEFAKPLVRFGYHCPSGCIGPLADSQTQAIVYLSSSIYIQMTKSLSSLSLAILAAGLVSAGSLHAQDAPAAPAAPAHAAPTPTDT